MKKLSVAAAMIALIATPALAADEGVTFGGREAVSINVSTKGLDLTKQSDVAKLRNRMNRAIAAACNPADRFALDTTRDTQCFQEMALNSSTQMQRMAQNDTGRAMVQN